MTTRHGGHNARIFVPLPAPPNMPRNQFGQPATRTRAETVTRLQEKARQSRGAATRERIRAQIGAELAQRD
jgi:hypothetical protein